MQHCHQATKTIHHNFSTKVKFFGILPRAVVIKARAMSNERMEQDLFYLVPETQPAVAEALSAAFAAGSQSPLLEAADLLVAACVRAVRLYPEWAELIDTARHGEVDSIAQHLVAATLKGLGKTG